MPDGSVIGCSEEFAAVHDERIDIQSRQTRIERSPVFTFICGKKHAVSECSGEKC
jgi:hypothetical protein